MPVAVRQSEAWGAEAVTTVADASAVREYVAAMSTELAQLARGVGDEGLARVLDRVVNLARGD